MSSVQYLREFIRERLTAAAEEIFGVFEKNIVDFEEEVDRQRRLLDIVWKPEIKLHRIEFPEQHVCTKEVLTDQQVCNQERDSSLDQEDPEPPQVKEEQEEICTSQEGEQPILKHETDTFMISLEYKESDHSGPEPEPDANLQVCNQERDSNLDQEDPKPQQIIEEKKEICTSQEGEQLVLKQETDTSVLTPNCEETDHKKPDRDQQLLSHNSPVAESQDQRGRKHVDSGSTRNSEPKTQKKRHKNKTHSNNVHKSPVLKIHTKTHKGEKSFKCDTCGKSFRYNSALNRHVRIHTGEKPYSCKICEKHFVRNNVLKIHMRTHTGERPYSCETCGKSFVQSSTFKLHVRTHTGEKPYPCSICGTGFVSMYVLKRHMNTHTGEKPYSCETCGKSFVRNSNLKVHVRIHTGEKPYPCNTCGKRFSANTALKKHTRIHRGEKPYSCNTCEEKFHLLSSLNAHLKIHTGEKPYSSNTCVSQLGALAKSH